jgi:hypothetical protein
VAYGLVRQEAPGCACRLEASAGLVRVLPGFSADAAMAFAAQHTLAHEYMLAL